jgi:hypothetical protein
MASTVVYSLEEAAKLTEEFLIPAQVAALLGCDQYQINLAARSEQGRRNLGFPVIKIGNRVKIPRRPFLKYMGWDGPIA